MIHSCNSSTSPYLIYCFFLSFLLLLPPYSSYLPPHPTSLLHSSPSTHFPPPLPTRALHQVAEPHGVRPQWLKRVVGLQLVNDVAADVTLLPGDVKGWVDPEQQQQQ